MAKTKTKEDERPWEGRLCRDCDHCDPYWRFETLTVKDRQPTMGVCPFRKYKVLLSENACQEHFRLKKVVL